MGGFKGLLQYDRCDTTASRFSKTSRVPHFAGPFIPWGWQSVRTIPFAPFCRTALADRRPTISARDTPIILFIDSLQSLRKKDQPQKSTKGTKKKACKRVAIPEQSRKLLCFLCLLWLPLGPFVARFARTNWKTYHRPT